MGRMQIIGVGLDATEIERVADMIERYGERFLRRVFTEGEIAYCHARRDFASSFAARFAAKEAAFKALGTGWAAGVKWKDVEIERLPSGKPQLHLHGEALNRAISAGAQRFYVSLTHDQLVSCAVVILEG